MLKYETDKKFIIEIPDPSMRQEVRSAPNFIRHIPLDRLSDVEILVNVDEIQSWNIIKCFPVRQFIESLAIEAMKHNLKMIAHHNKVRNQMVYHFQPDVTI